MESGVPQGSVLGPSLFLYYINDMPDNIRSTVRLFADDTIAYLTISSDADKDHLQEDLNQLADWEDTWMMKFHPEKCNVLSISKKKTSMRYSYTLHGHRLEHVTSAKYLGVTISSDLKWNTHISNICQRANNTIRFLKRNLNISNSNLKPESFIKGESIYKHSKTNTGVCVYHMGPIPTEQQISTRDGAEKGGEIC